MSTPQFRKYHIGWIVGRLLDVVFLVFVFHWFEKVKVKLTELFACCVPHMLTEFIESTC